MQLFPCPFCGPRPETEFHFGGEAGKTRPEPAPDVTAADWSRFLHLNRNPKGETKEIWLHLTCHEFFLLERDTATHAVLGARSLRKGEPAATAASDGEAEAHTPETTFAAEAGS
ncbi:MAG TPA: sarcosine oxidase subunit delta [Mesorhizobium sp.]|jgi:sarcosine oxidase subunit delta|nr:sarcosine oxidase subunit delta [Mesorhizobium sp.]